ncbi:hypothetical protein CDAR_226021 [Caerostris darwini]|uniref:Uncharacterized protein n=1 Tax=Caerostris darwini TaxID=1538125 RepID=A0AAV4VKR5_9ARAC|nr:hypothetical protein CDAR_226021 [Caerostris darwini]
MAIVPLSDILLHENVCFGRAWQFRQIGCEAYLHFAPTDAGTFAVFQSGGIDLVDICQQRRKRVRSTFPETVREPKLNGSVPGIGPEIRFRKSFTFYQISG